MQTFAFILALLAFAVFVADAVRTIERRLISIGLALATAALMVQLVVQSTNLVTVH